MSYRRITTYLAGALLALGLAGCGDEPAERCTQRTVPSTAGEVITQLGFSVVKVTPGATGTDPTQVRLRVCAVVPCLKGATAAQVTTSTGTLGGDGTAKTVTLTAEGASGQPVVGELVLSLPAGQGAYLQVALAEAAGASTIAADGTLAAPVSCTAPSR